MSSPSEKVIYDLLAAKDKLIEQLKEIVKVHQDRIEKLEQSRPWTMEVDDGESYVLVNTRQVDLSWKDAQASSYNLETKLDLLWELGIVECEECGGSGIIQHLETPLEPGGDYGWNQKCPDCHGHGWIITSVDVDKYGRNGT